MVTLVVSFLLPGPVAWSRLFRNSWDVLLYLVMLTLGLIYSSDLERGLRILETRFSLLAMPLILWRANHLDEEDMFALGKYFCYGLLVACVVCFANASINYFQDGNSSSFLYENLTGIVGAQPTYFAYYIVFAITFGLYMLYYHPADVRTVPTQLALMFMFLILMLTGGKTAFISLLLIFSFFVLKFTLEEKTLGKRIVFAMVCIMLIAIFVVNSVEYWTIEGDYWERMVLWESAINANPSPLIGVGTGDFNNVLNEYYQSKGMMEFAQGNYNAHNQFIQAYLTHGIIGLLIFLIVLARPLALSARNHDTLTTLIFFPFLIYGMTEVFLGRYQGVILFAFIQSMSMILARREREQMLSTHV